MNDERFGKINDGLNTSMSDRIAKIPARTHAHMHALIACAFEVAYFVPKFPVASLRFQTEVID